MYYFLTMTVGARAGTQYLLSPRGENRLGRDTECGISLTDPLCSRVHAVVVFEKGAWVVRDCQSRNGVFVNGQKTDEATLAPGHFVRIGSTEFTFHEAADPPAGAMPSSDLNVTQTVVKDTRVDELDTNQFALGAVNDPEQARDLLMLYQFALQLLGEDDPQVLVRSALELLKSRTHASVVGFLWIDDDGRLQPKLVIPEQPAQPIVLSETLTRLVSRDGHAVWIANQQSTVGSQSTLEHYADALCVPLVRRQRVLGAVHVYLDHGRFRQSQFDFAIAVANITAVALVRTLRETSVATDFRRLRDKSPGYDELLGDSAGILRLKDKIGRAAQATGCVLVRGESGTGKELVARALHRASPRADRPLLAVNAAAIPSELIDSQLFGHKAGSFTGADHDHAGFFKQADLGTLFLDEIGELPLAAQSKLLRILEGHPFLPVGGTKEVKVDVRVIAATNRDLFAYVQEKKFREDLYYRLAVFELVIPPLRERGGDIELLVNYFLDHFSRQHGRTGLRLTAAARAKLLGYSWPGNVRQLRNVIDSAVVLAAGDEIDEADLAIRSVAGEAMTSLRIDEWEQKLIAEAMRRTGQNVPEAARLLGIGRATLYRKLEESKPTLDA